MIYVGNVTQSKTALRYRVSEVQVSDVVEIEPGHQVPLFNNGEDDDFINEKIREIGAFHFTDLPKNLGKIHLIWRADEPIPVEFLADGFSLNQDEIDKAAYEAAEAGVYAGLDKTMRVLADGGVSVDETSVTITEQTDKKGGLKSTLVVKQ